MDNTYNTNTWKLPLFLITGMTNIGSNFNLAFGLVDNEREDGFSWLISQLHHFQIELSTPVPRVIITDHEKTLKNALVIFFEPVIQQLCLFHQTKNMIANIKKKWIDLEADPSVVNISDEVVGEPLTDLRGVPVSLPGFDEVEYSLVGLYSL